MSITSTVCRVCPFCWLLISLDVTAQVRINNLYFNSTQNILRLDFSTGQPVPVYTGVAAVSRNPTEPNVGEGIAHAEDAQGNIIIWVNSNGVYDRNGTLMPGSTGIRADASSTEIVVCPWPNDPRRYYVFYNDQKCSALYYAVVEMTQRGGLGDVTSLNTVLDAPNSFAEGMEIIRIPCTRDYWLVTYQCYVGFKRFRISAGGIGNGALVQAYNADNHQGRGELDYYNGRIGYAVTYRNRAFLADFDPATGTFANGREVRFAATNGMYGLEFSPDGTKAYLTDWYNLDFLGNIASPNLFQYDFTTQAVRSWRLPLNATVYPSADTEGLGQLELGRDGKLYTPFVKGKEILVVDTPNDANPSFSTIAVSSVLSTGVSDHIQSDVYQPMSLAASRTEVCPGEGITLTASGSAGPFRWSSGSGTSSTLSVRPNTTTTYWVYARNRFACEDSASVTVRINNTIPTLTQRSSGTPCAATATLRATSGLGAYEWLLNGQPLSGTTTDSLVANRSGTYQVITRSSSCPTESNQVTVSLPETDKLFVPNVITPDNDATQANETFRVRGYSGTIRLTICNRWGQAVYQSDDYQNDWRADTLPSAVYFYYLRHANDCFAAVRGWVQVLRGEN